MLPEHSESVTVQQPEVSLDQILSSIERLSDEEVASLSEDKLTELNQRFIELRDEILDDADVLQRFIAVQERIDQESTRREKITDSDFESLMKDERNTLNAQHRKNRNNRGHPGWF